MANIEKVGKDNQVYGDFTKSGKHYIYYHCLPHNGEVFYVGLGKYNRCNQINQRNQYWKSVVKKYGFKIYIFTSDLTVSEAVFIEKELIKLWKPKCNLTNGGDTSFPTNNIVVYAYKKNGEFYKRFSSISEANVFVNAATNSPKIGKCLSGGRLSYKGYLWKNFYSEKISPYKKPPIYNIKKVYRYDLDGNFMESYEKVCDFKEGARTGITNTLDKNLTCHNSFWRTYYKEKIEVPIILPALKEPKKVINTLNGEVFESISKAAKYLNCCRSTLERKLYGVRKNNTTLQWLKM